MWPNLIVTAAIWARASEVLAQVSARDLRDRLVGEMSAGEQRWVMIARALAGNAEEHQMLLLDEPSDALDLRAQHALRVLLGELAEEGVGS